MHVSLPGEIRNFLLESDGGASKTIRDMALERMLNEPVRKLTMLEAEKEAITKRLTELEIEIPAVKSEIKKAEEAKVTVASAKAPVKKIVLEDRVPEAIARLRRALSTIDAKKAGSFLKAHGHDRLTEVSSAEAVAMIKELETE